MRALGLTAILLLFSAAASGQPGDARDAQAVIIDLADAVEAELDCDIAVLTDEPRFDELSDRWLTNYSASGSGCDEASQALHDRGLANGILFARRPTLEQLMVLIRPMVRSAESAFFCRITLQGTPRIEPVTGQWFVPYLASGDGCDDAAAHLREQGAPLQIVFLRRFDNQILMR